MLKSLELSYQLEEPQEAAWRLMDMSSFALRNSDPQRMMNYLQKCLDIAHEIKDYRLMGTAKGALAAAIAMQNKIDIAEEYMREALEFNLIADNVLGQIQMLSYLGSVHIQKEDYEPAIAYAQEAIEKTRLENYFPYYPQNLDTLVMAYKSQGNFEKAYEILNELIQYSRRVGLYRHVSMGLYRYGNIKLLQAQYYAALSYYEEALVMFFKESQNIFASFTMIEMVRALLEIHAHESAAILAGCNLAFMENLKQDLSPISKALWEDNLQRLEKLFDKDKRLSLFQNGRELMNVSNHDWLSVLLKQQEDKI